METRRQASGDMLLTAQNYLGQFSELVDLVTENAAASAESLTKGTLGEQLFIDLPRRRLVEFDRSIVGLFALDWVLKDDYDAFTACQKGFDKLSPEDFAELRAITLAMLPTKADQAAMRAFIVINDLGKVRGVIDKLRQETGIDEVDHDKVLLAALERFPEISPSFSQLSAEYKEDLLEGLRSEFNFAQFLQAESVPASLASLRGMNQRAFNFLLLHSLYDIAGAAGNTVQNGSLTFTHSTSAWFQAAATSLEGIFEGELLDIVYANYLTKRAEFLKSDTFELDVNHPTDRAIIRICCMLRIKTTAEAERVANVFVTQLDEPTRNILETELGRTGLSDTPATLIYYAPALLLNTIESFRTPYKPRLHQPYDRADETINLETIELSNYVMEGALQVGLTNLAQLFIEARVHMQDRREPGVFTLLAAQPAELAKKDPAALVSQQPWLEAVGNDARAWYRPPQPEIHLEAFPQMRQLSETVRGRHFVLVVLGGGSDPLQALVMARLLKREGKHCAGVIDIKSQLDPMSRQRRFPIQPGEELDRGVYHLTPKTRMSDGRFFGDILASELPQKARLIMLHDDVALRDQLAVALQSFGSFDTIIGIDSGGDSLQPFGTSEYPSITTPDQDHAVLQSLAHFSGVSQVSAIVSINDQAPRNAEGILQRANAQFFIPSAAEANLIMATYADVLARRNNAFLGRTTETWVRALHGERGLLTLRTVPKKLVSRSKDIWNPYVVTGPHSSSIFLMNASDHRQVIGMAA